MMGSVKRSQNGPGGISRSSGMASLDDGLVGLDVVLSQRSYFAGDVVKCRVYFYFSETARQPVLLEWASVQVHGHVAFDPHLVSPRDAEDVALEAEAGYDPVDRAKRLRQASDSGFLVLHRAEDSMQVLRKTNSMVQVGKAQSVSTGKKQMNRSSSFSEYNLSSLDGYDDCLDFLHNASASASPSMPDVTLLAGKYGSCLFASPPEVITCMYEGSAARYFYVLTVGAKLSNRDVAQILHIPIRICSSIGIDDDHSASIGKSLSSSCSSSGSGGRREGSVVTVDKHGRESRLRSFSSFLLEEHDFNVRSWVLGETTFKRKTDTTHGKSARYSRFIAADTDLPLSINHRNERFRVVDMDSTGIVEKTEKQHSPTSVKSVQQQGKNKKGNTEKKIKGIGEQIYRIGSESRHMAHLHMYKNSVCPGEQILLAFDFSDALVPCYQVTVALEVEERSKCPPPLQSALDPLTFDKKNNGSTTPSSSTGSSQVSVDGNNSNSPFGSGPWTRVVFSRSVQVAFNLTRTMMLTIPVDASPDFETDLISVQNFLRFEFVTGKVADPADSATKPKPSSTKMSFPLTNRQTQTSPWRIPLRILPIDHPTHPEKTNNAILLLSSSAQSSMLHVRAWL